MVKARRRQLLILTVCLLFVGAVGVWIAASRAPRDEASAVREPAAVGDFSSPARRARPRPPVASKAPVIEKDALEPQGGVLAGWVVSAEDLRPISGAELVFLEMAAFEVQSDDSGAFTFVAPHPGTYQLTEVRAEGYRSAEGAVFRAQGGRAVRGVLIPLRPKPLEPERARELLPAFDAALAGRVVDSAAGEAIAGARVSVSVSRLQLTGSLAHELRDDPERRKAMLALYYWAPARSTRTASDGTFRIETHRHATYRVRATHSEHVAAEVTDIGAEAELRIEMQSGGSLSGTVRGPDGPVGAFSVHWQAEEGDKWRKAEFFSAEGRYHLGALEPGVYRARVFGQGFAPSDPEWVEIRPGDETIYDADLVRGSRLPGRVIDVETSAPIEDAVVSSDDWDVRGSAAGRTARAPCTAGSEPPSTTRAMVSRYSICSKPVGEPRPA